MLYDTILTIHIISFVWNVSFVILSDIIGGLWIVGVARLPKLPLRLFHICIWAGLSVSIVTGLYMFTTASSYLLTVPAFYTKIFFVLALLINSFLIAKHLHKALSVASFSDLPSTEKRSFIVSGAISTISWIGVVVSAAWIGL